MASVVVFVDDAIRGDLPGVCVKTGAPATCRVRLEQSLDNSIGVVALLLIFLGPIGWIVLLALATRRREVLRVQLPFSDEGVRRDRMPRRICGWSAVGSVGILFLGLMIASYAATTWAVIAAIGMGVALIAYTVAYFNAIDIDIDVSRRWVTLSNVHPGFAAAVERSRSERRAPTR